MWASHPQTQYPSPGPKPDEETERNAEPEWNPGLFSKKKIRVFYSPARYVFPRIANTGCSWNPFSWVG